MTMRQMIAMAARTNDDGVGAELVEVAVALLDQRRDGLGAAGDAAGGDDPDGAELAERPGQASTTP